jgi:type IX secretion system PorP/SprF family membrane protein
MKISVLIIVCLLASKLLGQDIHWSQFDWNPIFQNPGNTGLFDGDYRFHANYRDQWRSVTVPFQTLNITAEAKNVYKNLSVGMFLFHDVVGDGQFRTVEVIPTFSYAFKLTPDSVHVLRPAVQFGLNYRQMNADAFNFDSQWNGVFFDPMLPTNELFQTQRRGNANTGVGAVYEYLRDKKNKITAGIGLFNINKPNQGFFGEDILRERRMNVFARWERNIGFDWDILPSMQLNLQGTYRELMLGSMVKYTLVNRMGDYKAIYGGAYMRAGDSGMLMVGMDYQNWRGGISYDVNFSKLYVASRARGGVELSLVYIVKRIRKSNQFFRVCPDYI